MKKVAAMRATGREQFFQELRRKFKREPVPELERRAVSVEVVKLRDRQLMLGECHGRPGA
jgi:hypothetical protein